MTMSPACADTADVAALARSVAASALGTDVTPGQADRVLDRVTRPDFTRWQAHAARAHGCSRPVRLRGSSTTIDARTGEVVESFDSADLPDAVVYSRAALAAPRCALRARSGTGGVRTTSSAPGWLAARAFRTPSRRIRPLSSRSPRRPSAPSTRDTTDPAGPARHHARLAPCRPRRDRPTCRHGRSAYCGAVHGDGDARTGTPLCLDCYDHAHQIAWNAFVPRLWTRTIDAVKRELRRLSRARGHAGPSPVRQGRGVPATGRRAPARPTPARRLPPGRPGRRPPTAGLGNRRAAQCPPGRRRTFHRDPDSVAPGRVRRLGCPVGRARPAADSRPWPAGR